MKPKKISLIITTYNWPQALERVLEALAQQTDRQFEVLVADDGSKIDTQQMVNQFKQRLAFPLLHVRQEDQGFRAAAIRNKAAAQTRGDYLVFIDGDCIPDQHFVARHRALAEAGYLVAGSRLLLSKKFSKSVLQEQLTIAGNGHWFWLRAFLHKQCNGWLATWYWPFNLLRKIHTKKWQGAKTCNLAIWKKDFMAVNGLDEAFEGWGHEDAELVVRLMRHGILRKSGRNGPLVFHLYHKEASRQKEEDNLQRLAETLRNNHTQALQGVNQYFDG